MGCMCGGCSQCLSDQGFVPEDFEDDEYESYELFEDFDIFEEDWFNEYQLTPNEKLSQEMLRKIRENE